MKKLFIAFFLLIATDKLNAQSSFYQGKTIRIIVGYLAGDNHDLWARAYGRFMGKHIPGNPDFVVQNMPGAGHMIAANYVYNIAKPDGLTIAAINASLYFEQLIGRAEVKFDWTKYTWIGTRPNRLKFSTCAWTARTKPSKMRAAPKSRRNAGLRARVTWVTSCRNS
jgi:tripartite-type tricarboxylate transporter receptor subunit TctC